MKKHKYVLGGIFLTIILLLLATYGIYETKTQEEKVMGGQLTLGGIQDTPAITLDGEWEVYWNEIIDPPNLWGLETEGEYTQFPQLWKVRTGTATYRMFFNRDDLGHLDKEGGLAIKMPFVYSAYRLWLNGELIATNGKVGLSQEEERLTRNPQVITISPRGGRNELVLQISNHHFYRGGINKSIIIGSALYLFNMREGQIALDIFMAGSFFIAGVIFFFLYFNRRREKAILYFSTACFFFLLRALISNEVFISKLLPNFNWAIGNRIEASFSYIGVPVVILLLSELYRGQFVLKYIKAWKVMGILGLFIITLLPHKVYDIPLMYLNIAQVMYMIYLFTTFIKYFDKSLPDFYILLIGKSVLSYYALHDIMVIYSSMDASLKMNIGMYVFIFFLGYALVLHLYREFAKVEALVLENESMLKEISKMNQELEILVEKRTSELELTNRQLFELSMVDGLTRIPNRMQFDKKMKEFLLEAAKNSQTLSVLFLDIDFFKNYNDNYGHIKGDEALKDISKVLHQRVKGDENSFIARYGGEEFVLLYKNKNIEETYREAENLRKLVYDMKIPHHFSPIANRITVSIGGISTIPEAQDDATIIVDKADKALYRAKKGGRNKTCMWDYNSSVYYGLKW